MTACVTVSAEKNLHHFKKTSKQGHRLKWEHLKNHKLTLLEEDYQKLPEEEKKQGNVQKKDALFRKHFPAAIETKATEQLQYLLPRTGNTSTPKINL